MAPRRTASRSDRLKRPGPVLAADGLRGLGAVQLPAAGDGLLEHLDLVCDL